MHNNFGNSCSNYVHIIECLHSWSKLAFKHMKIPFPAVLWRIDLMELVLLCLDIVFQEDLDLVGHLGADIFDEEASDNSNHSESKG